MKLNKLAFRLTLEKFIKEDLWQYALVFGCIFAFAWLFDKYIEAVFFCLSHHILRIRFDKQYHSASTQGCLLITLFIAFVGITITLSSHFSLLSCIPITFFICWIGHIAQDRNDLVVAIVKQENKLKEPNIYAMSESELRTYCQSKKLNPIEADIVCYIIIEHLKDIEIYNKIAYSKSQYFRIKKKIKTVVAIQ